MGRIGEYFNKLVFSNFFQIPSTASCIDFGIQIIEALFNPVAHVFDLVFVDRERRPSFMLAIVDTVFKQFIILVLNQLHDMVLGENAVAQSIISCLGRGHKAIRGAVGHQAVKEAVTFQSA